MNSKETLFKAVIVGNPKVGKTSLLLQFCDSTFIEALPPSIGVDFRMKTFQRGGSVRMLQIWDIASDPIGDKVRKLYFKGAKILVFVYSITDADSFQAIERFVVEANETKPEEAVLILAGNKLDIAGDRKVTKEEGESLARKHSMKFFEVSAKEDTDLEEKTIKLFYGEQ